MTSLALVLLAQLTLPSYATEFRFEDFAVPVDPHLRPAPPKIQTAAAQRFRTQLRQQASEGANFAGHLRVADWGCGTCCIQFGIVDLKTGHVWMPNFYLSCGYPMPDPIKGDAGLFYRVDSALFVAIGSKNEGRTSAVYYYRWDGTALRLLKVAQEVRNQ